MVDHPLALNETPDSPEPPPIPLTSIKLTPVTANNIAKHLTSNDANRIRILVREFCIKALIPHIERQMRILNEIVTNRSKSRSFLSGAKRYSILIYSKKVTVLINISLF